MRYNSPFSKRMGYAESLPIQLESCDESLRTDLYNIYLEFEELDRRVDFIPPRFNDIKEYFWAQYFHKPINDYQDRKYHSLVRELFLNGPWFETYGYLELVLSTAVRLSMKYSYYDYHIKFFSSIPELVNSELEKNNSGFRFLSNEYLFVPVTSDVELVEIENALSATQSEYDGANEHLKAALRLFADKEAPDYRNSIKESISAVEYLCQTMSGSEGNTLTKALKWVQAHGTHEIPTVLSKSFETLYGWTNDSSGIRHALSDGDSPVDVEEARFMLIACSAFVNYLIVKIDSARE